jgi:hypothetical protein
MKKKLAIKGALRMQEFFIVFCVCVFFLMNRFMWNSYASKRALNVRCFGTCFAVCMVLCRLGAVSVSSSKHIYVCMDGIYNFCMCNITTFNAIFRTVMYIDIN